jgi:hypothetical protein
VALNRKQNVTILGFANSYKMHEKTAENNLKSLVKSIQQKGATD